MYSLFLYYLFSGFKYKLRHEIGRVRAVIFFMVEGGTSLLQSFYSGGSTGSY